MSSLPPLTGPMVPPPSLPPDLLRFLLWLEKTEGRDKLLRLVVYSSKWLTHTLQTSATADPELLKRIKAGASVVATSRKLFRMFRSLDFLQDALESLAQADSAERVFSFIKGISLALWLLMDHLQWLHKAGYLRLAPATLAKVDVYHSQAWFSGLLFGAFLCLYRLQLLVKQERRLLVASFKQTSTSTPQQRNDSADANQRALLKLQEKKANQVLGVMKNGTDLIIPAARLGWAPVSDGVVGMAGTLTSLIGIYTSYPTPLKLSSS